MDGLRGFHGCALYVFLGHDDILSFFVLIALDDVIPVDLLAGFLVVALVTHRSEIPAVKQVQVESTLAFCRIQLYRDVDETKTDGTFPNGSWHKETIDEAAMEICGLPNLEDRAAKASVLPDRKRTRLNYSQ